MRIVISIDLEKPEKDEGCDLEDTQNFTTEEDPAAVHDQKIPSDYLSQHWNKEPKVTPPSKLGKTPEKPANSKKKKEEDTDDKD